MRMPLPSHPSIREGCLPNGLKYIILPNSAPPERFEAHLEIFAGSADELSHQQGMAHLVEHVAYMGSRKRERLFGTGSQTNAYTDFHHTVFYASCPVLTPPGWGRRTAMLPRALDALCDVLEAKCEPARLEKERAAVLSEMTMVNTIDYRVECQILSALHAENQLSRRFPIGKEELIKAWQVTDIKEFHGTHYKPDNAMLYIIGDVQIEQCEEQIRKVFGHLQPSGRNRDLLTLKTQSMHFPPVTHHWSGGRITPDKELPVLDTIDGRPMSEPKVFQHSLVQSFSLHVFAKRPIESVRSLLDFRRAIMKRVVLAALQIRLSVNSRSDPPFTSIEFNQLDSPREACSVCYLDMTAEPSKWKEAVKLAVREIRRLGMYGLTHGELMRFSSALLTDAQQLAAQGDRIGNADQLTFLMESISSGHTFMDTQQTYEATRLVVESLTLEDVNQVAAEICEHMTLYGVPGAPQPSAIIACAPTEASCPPENIPTEEMLQKAIEEGVCEEISASTDISVPSTLFSQQELEAMTSQPFVKWAEFVDKEGLASGGQAQPQQVYRYKSSGVVQRRLGNGIKVNVKVSSEESQRGMLRIIVPGGRQLESVFGKGSVAIGARTMQEGGAFEGWAREQVELFCIDHLVMVTVDANEESLFLDFSFPTTKLHSRGDDVEGGADLSGAEAALQVVNKILTGFVWEEDALNRAKQNFMQSHEALVNSLEGSSTEQLMARISGEDSRFMSVPYEGVSQLSLEQVRSAIMSQLTTDEMEISLVGDFTEAEAERLILQYIGAVPESARELGRTVLETESLPVPEPGADRHVDVHLMDSDERAIAYVAGSGPNRWGVLRNGERAVDRMNAAEGTPSKETLQRRSHPLFPAVTLFLLKEVINRRLFSTVREQKRLTYDANFHLTAFERLMGSWYLVTVTANPAKAEAALQACKDTLSDMASDSPITYDNCESAKRVLINRHENDMRTHQYWCELLSGIQCSSSPQKDMSCIRDYEKVVNSVTARDLQLMLQTVTTDPKEVFSCIGVSGAMPRHPPGSLAASG